MTRQRFVAKLETVDDALRATDFFEPEAPALPFAAEGDEDFAAGDLVEVRLHSGQAHAQGARLARAGSAAAAMYEVAREFDLDPIFGPEVEAELEAIVADPGIDDPALEDLRALPFVTIDNPDSRDLDQAMFLARLEGGGYRVAYALADAAWFVRPGTALFHAALARGSSYYLPGFAVPMLPRKLSEDLVSLNPRVDRRALVLDMQLDAQGEVASTRFVRARIHSQAKLSYPGVQEFYDHPADSPKAHALAGKPYTETLELLREVGERRMRLAAERDVVRYRRQELEVTAGPAGTRFTVMASDRKDCERYNEQISLLCNTEGARLFAEAGRLPNLQPVFRVHEPPHHRRVAELARLIEALCARLGIEREAWAWRRSQGESLAEYLDRLPFDGDRGGLGRAIQRQALVINNRSEFDDEAGPHHGVGADAYARFSSPMREIVGIYTHKEALELLEGKAGEAVGPEEAELQARIIEAGNRAKRLQSQVTKAANKIAIDAILAPDLELPVDQRPRRRGVLLGLSPTKAYVELADPPVELKVYFEGLAEGPFACRADPSLLAMHCGPREVMLGETLELRVVGEAEGRWTLAPLP